VERKARLVLVVGFRGPAEESIVSDPH